MASLPLLLLVILLFHFSPPVSSFSIGVNYGTLGNNLPPPTQVASFLRQNTLIDRVKLFDSNPDLISAFANTGISLVITLPNSDIPSVTQLPTARSWVSAHIAPFYPSTNITLLCIGNEVIHSQDPTLISRLVPAMRSISAALIEAGMPNIRVTTPHSLGILAASEPPSAGRFRYGYQRYILGPMLEFHRRSKSPFMVNAYPYFGYTGDTVDYALFRPNKGKKDATTGITYTNLFDAQMDAVYSAMKRMGYGDVEIVLGETGWPWEAEPGQAGVSVRDARTFNMHLISHVNSGKGTPLMPGRRFETYIFALFNENLKPGPNAERHWGLFNPDFTPVYDVGIMRPGAGGGGTPAPAPVIAKKWCVSKVGASTGALQANINYACSNGADCAAIQAGGMCFEPNTLESHASYAMNSYFQKSGRNDFNCDFGQTGVITTADPSHGTCRFTS